MNRTGHTSIFSHLAANIAFNALDTNGDGRLSGDEAFGMFRNYGVNNSRYGGYPPMGNYGGYGGYGAYAGYGGYSGYGGYPGYHGYRFY